MGKKAITIIMTVTVVIALFAFGSLVALRPDSEGGFMSGLFPKSAPVAEEAQAETEPKVTEAEILLALTDSEDLRAIVREEVAEKINDIALEGADVDVDLLRETILREVSDALIESELQAMEALEEEAEELRSENRELRTGLEELRNTVADIASRQEKTDRNIADLEARLKAETEALINEKIEGLKELFASADRAVFESVIDELVLLEDDIYAYIDSELEREFAELTIMPIAPESGEAAVPAVSEERLVEIFAENILAASRSNTGDTVYDEIVYNVASDVMAMLAQQDAKAYGELTEYRDASYDVIELVVNEILDRLAANEALAYSVIEEAVEEPAEEVVPVEEVVEEPAFEEIVEEPVEEVVEEPVVEEVVEEPVPELPKTPIITRPGFDFDNTKIDTTRTDARDAAISGVIDALRNQSK